MDREMRHVVGRFFVLFFAVAVMTLVTTREARGAAAGEKDCAAKVLFFSDDYSDDASMQRRRSVLFQDDANARNADTHPLARRSTRYAAICAGVASSSALIALSASAC